MSMEYRADISGLRALAVLPILFFHAGIKKFSGGFVGVDIFFVISGFLITGIIIRELEKGSFSITSFYHRRIVRIFPALLTTLLVTLVSGAFLLYPEELRALGLSAMASTAFASNIWFWTQADYFGYQAEVMPLLHTWSLGVEEQFYIFYPLILLGLKRYFPERICLALILITVASLAVGLALSQHNPSDAFYLIPARAWELSLGGIVALGGFPKLSSKAAIEAAATLGLILIVLTFFVIRESRFFPVPLALAPCGGAALLIAYGKDAWTAKLLSSWPAVAIGTISYSLYLWHWPIIVFYRLEHGVQLSLADSLLLVLVSIFVATLSYHFIESPILRRFRHGRPSRSIPIGLAGIAATVAIAGGVVMAAPNIRTYSPEVSKIIAFESYLKTSDVRYQFRRGTCFVGGNTTPFQYDFCLRQSTDRPNLLVLGDSHAAHIWRAISERYPNYNVIQATASGCLPVIRPHGDSSCTEVIGQTIERSMRSWKLRGVVLSAEWKTLPKISDQLSETIRMFRSRGVAVTVLGPSAEYHASLPTLLARSIEQHRMALAENSVGIQPAMESQLRSIVEQAGGRYVSMYAIQCPQGHCRLFAKDGTPFLFDANHFTLQSSREMVAGLPPF